MKIKTRLTINFSLLVAGILLFFSVSVYLFYLQHRHENFAIRLKNKAINTATLLFSIKGIDSQLLKIIDDNTVTNMNDVTVIILDKKKKIVYSNQDSIAVLDILPQFGQLNLTINDRIIKDKRLYLCFQRSYNKQDYYILATAIDLYGQQELQNLQIILISVFIFSILLIIFAGYFNARQSLQPIKEVVGQVDNIKANSLSNRLVLKSKDEIAELSDTFNKMLERIEQAFETERTFVSNVSHELRTPVTSIIGQIEVALLKERDKAEYNLLLVSILDDIKNMKNIINGFLELAEASITSENHKFSVLRTDELLFSVKDEILRRKPNYIILIEFEDLPDDEKEVSIMGNERLLRIMLTNLIDNACKFSEQQRVSIKIGYDLFKVTLRFVDSGIGIPSEDQIHIFEPLYRAKNAMGKEGHGIGLSIVKRIADIHNASITINSELNVGTAITLTFSNLKTKYIS
jgi:Signal transduction histidine kinase